MSVKGSVGRRLAPMISELAPGLTTSFVREALDRAIDGVGPLPPAAVAADKQLAEQRGHVERAVHEVIENHVRLAGAQGFLTNVGGLITAAVAIPANIVGLTLLQCRMIAGIAHLRGHDLDDPRVRNAILMTLLGEDTVTSMVQNRKLPAPPMALVTAPAHDADLDGIIAAEVATDLITRVAGKRLAISVGRRVPVVGGVVGMGADGYATWRIGRYADRELLPRTWSPDAATCRFPLQGSTPSSSSRARATPRRCGRSLQLRGVDLGHRGVHVLPAWGVTNYTRLLREVRDRPQPVTVAGLYDAAEERFVVRALVRSGVALDEARPALDRHGFFGASPTSRTSSSGRSGSQPSSPCWTGRGAPPLRGPHPTAAARRSPRRRAAATLPRYPVHPQDPLRATPRGGARPRPCPRTAATRPGRRRPVTRPP